MQLDPKDKIVQFKQKNLSIFLSFTNLITCYITRLVNFLSLTEFLKIGSLVLEMLNQ